VVPTASAPADDAPANRIVGAALVDSQAYDKLSYLGDRIGHRLSGSEALEQAVAWSVRQFKRDGIENVWTEKVMVPHWVRGDEQAWIVAPRKWEMAILALGGSVGTPEQGLTADVIEVDGFEQLEAVADAVPGKIVLFNRAIEAGFGSERGYGSVVKLRGDGPSRAAELGGVGMLIRSLGTADYRLPHTGALRYAEDVEKIPAAAISAEDAEMIHRLLESGVSVRVHMELGARTYPDAESANVIAEIRGRELPDEIVLIGAHLDSWDVGHGAHDDGAGCVVVMETLRLLHKLGLTPRRTIRAVLFTNEENGLRGGKDYARRHADEHHVAAIEMDGGAMAPRGFGVSAGAGGLDLARRLAEPLAVIGADEIFPNGGGADIGPLKRQGVPVLGLIVDSVRYFDYHHTAADTVDKVDRRDLDRNVAAMALMAWGLAEDPATLPRVEVEAKD
jgi:Zn-dependent M28 family amino/carboxypeptidase